jgi:glycosyltransferase involved in cell wall biosynthesis
VSTLPQEDFSRVSVVVPVTLMAGKLDNFKSWALTLDSKYHLIVVHDQGNDQTSDELQDFLARGLNCEYTFVEGKYGSPGETRNAGLKHVNSDWVIFWDSDDIGHVHLLNLWLEENDKNQADLIIFRYSKFDLATNTLSTSPMWEEKMESNHFAWLLEPGLWRCLLRTKSVEQLRFTDLRMGEDQIYVLDVLAQNMRCEFSNTVLYEYYVSRSGQLTTSKSAVKEILHARKEILDRRETRVGLAQMAIEIMWIRLSLTALKRLDIGTKVYIFLSLMLRNVFSPATRRITFQIFRKRQRKK